MYRAAVQRVLLVANPAASGFTGALHRNVTKVLSDRFLVDAVWPTSPAENTRMCADAAKDGFYAVIAMGGDGVVHHAANGVANTATALGIIPAGTTNVVARIYGMPRKAVACAEALTTGRLATAPLAHIATSSGTGARSTHAVFAAGIGYDADMVALADQRPTSKYYFGAVHYARSAANALLTEYRNRPANLSVTCDGERLDAVAVLVQVHDPFTYFGRLPLRLTNKNVLGLSVLVIESLALARSIPILLRSTAGRGLDKVKGVHLLQDPTKIVVEADPPSRYQADGELLGSTDWIEITPEPHGLLTLVPS